MSEVIDNANKPKDRQGDDLRKQTTEGRFAALAIGDHWSILPYVGPFVAQGETMPWRGRWLRVDHVHPTGGVECTLVAEPAPRPTPAPDPLPSPAEAAPILLTSEERREQAVAQGFLGDGCNECGNFTMVRNGTCLKCNTCGATTGCS